MNEHGAESVERRPRIAALWREQRARWTLPLVIIVIIGLVAIVDHLGSHRISHLDDQNTSALVPAAGGAATVEFDRPWDGFNPNTPAGAASTTPALLSAVLPSAYVMNAKMVPVVNSALLLSVEVQSTSPLTIEYVINPAAVWSDGVPFSAADFIYAWQSQSGDGLDVDGQPDRVASTLGYRDVSSVTPSHGGKTVTVVFSAPFTDWRVMFSDMVPAHIATRVGWNHGFDTFDPAIDLSAGPLLLKSVSSQRTAVLVRNPKWWGVPSVLDKVTVHVAQDQATWTGALSDDNQTVAQPTGFDVGSLGTVSSLPNTQSEVKPSLDLLELDFNVNAAVTFRTVAREAIAHAISRTGLLQQTFGPIDPALVINQDHLAVASQPNYNQSSASGEYGAEDLAATDRLMKSLGYHKDLEGDYVDGAGKRLLVRMAVESGDPWIDQVAGEITMQLVHAGFDVVTFPVDGTEGMEAASATNSYDMALVTRTASPFETTTAAWYSDGLGLTDSTGTQNWSHFDDPEVDQLFIQAAEALNPVSGGAIYAQIDDQLWDQMVALPLFQEPALMANGVQLANVQYNATGDGIMWNVALWTLLKPGPPNH
ncbi:MAG: ABC transporter substrate-binding protein [Acidimicrobiales bacterium]